MKIKKVDEKPMVLHVKKKPKLHIRKEKKMVLKRADERRSRIPWKKEYAKSGIKVKSHRLKTMAFKSARLGGKQMEGGEEIEESVEVMEALSSPMRQAAKKGSSLYRRRKTAKKAEKKRTKKLRRMHTESEYAAANIKMRKSGPSGKSAKGGRKSSSKGKEKSSQKNGSFVKERMLESFLGKLQTEQEYDQGGMIDGTVKSAKAAAMLAVKKIVAALAPFLLGLFAMVAIVGVIVAAVLAVIYNSPLSLFFPQPDTGYESPRTVLCEYYKEFHEEILRLEEQGMEITYQNEEDGAPVSNFNDTLMVYMVKYGTGQTGFVMDETGKANLKEVFDAMNYYDTSESTKEIKAGESLGKVVTTGYCSCSICCGKWAGGHTASGTVPKGNHTLAVDAHSPKVPMGTKIVMNGRTYKVEDTGAFAKYGTDFDIYFDSHEQALKWGKRTVEAYLADGDKNTVKVTMSGTMVHNLTYEDYIALDLFDEDQVSLLRDMMDSDLWDNYYDVAGGSAVAELAMTKIGCHYSKEKRYEEGWYDCSSLVQRLYKEVGIALPATAADQGKYCYENAMLINKKDLKPGDLIFYSYETNGKFRNISHVAIYVGEGKMVHAANPRRGVVLDPLRTNHVVFYARPY